MNQDYNLSGTDQLSGRSNLQNAIYEALGNVQNDINLNNVYRVVNSAEPLAPQDTTTKAYVDTKFL